MCVRVKELADYIVTKCTEDDHPVSNLQLQKMLYFLQYVYAKQTGGKLLFNEQFEAWPYGPVMRDVYFEFSKYGGRPIEEIRRSGIRMSPTLKSFVDAGIESLRERSPWDLVRLSHAPGTPWDQVYQDGLGNGRVISNDMIVRAAMESK